MIEARQAYFIKLGSKGEWEGECLRDGTLRLGYSETPHELCLNRNWEGVRQFWETQRGDAGTATRDKNQIQVFYEANQDDLFITFAKSRLYWCRPQGAVELLADGGRRRNTKGGWDYKSVNGTQLTADRLSGHLLKVQMFQGTICRVTALNYLLRKLNDQSLPEVADAEKAESALMEAVIRLIRLLTWQDFELLVDLIFSTSGWRRIGVVGRTQKMVDIEIVLPTTSERAFVQIKSQTNQADFCDYVDRFLDSDSYSRMFFVWHTGNVVADERVGADKIQLIGPERLARMILDAGLASWLRKKVS